VAPRGTVDRIAGARTGGNWNAGATCCKLAAARRFPGNSMIEHSAAKKAAKIKQLLDLVSLTAEKVRAITFLNLDRRWTEFVA
jgi:hypothetical protein